MSTHVTFTLDEVATINNSIDQMYKAVATADSIHPFARELLTCIRETFFFDKGNFIVINANGDDSHEVETFLSLGWNKSDVDIYIDKYFGVDDVIPMLTKNNPIAFRNNDFFAIDERSKTSYYKEFVESSKIQTSIDANILLNGVRGKKMIMGFFRDPGKIEFSEKDLEIVKLLQPHLSNIFSKYLKKRPEVEYSPIDGVWHSFDTLGICMLDSKLDVISYNAVYSTFTNDNALGNNLEKMIRRYCHALSSSAEKSSVIDSSLDTLSAPEDDPASAAVNENFIIEVTKHESPHGERFVALVYSISDIFLFRFKDLSRRYNLSSREYEVLLLTIGKGFTVDEIAVTLYVSVSTVKKHISSAYQKMNIKSQKQLISLLRFM